MLYVVMVRVVLFSYFIPGMIGFLHGFYKWVFDSLEVLNGFLGQVVVSRGDVGIRQWTRWLREDLSSRPYVWLRPDFVPPPPFLGCQGSSCSVFSDFRRQLCWTQLERKALWSSSPVTLRIWPLSHHWIRWICVRFSLVDLPCCTRSLIFSKVAFRGAVRVALKAVLQGSQTHSVARNTQGWKLLMLLPRLLLHRPPRGGKVSRKKFEELFQRFHEGRSIWASCLCGHFADGRGPCRR